VVACKDEVAQGYLMQCVAAVFPDDFHVGTLDVLLGALPQLQPGVKLATVMGSLLERLAIYASNSTEIVAQLDATDAFTKMRKAAASAVEEHLDMPGADLAALYTGLLSFAGAVYPTRTEYVDDVLGTCAQALGMRQGLLENDVRGERQLVALLTSPLERYGIQTVLGLKHYAPLLNVLTPSRRREMGRRVAESAIRSFSASRQTIASPAAVKTLFEYMGPVTGKETQGADVDEDDIKEDAALLGRVINTLRSSEAEKQYEIVNLVLPLLVQGGSVRAAAAIPPLCFLALETLRTLVLPLGQRTGDNSLKGGAVDAWYRFLHRAASALADARAAELALEIFLTSAVSASQDAKMEIMAYECFEQAFTLFEESIADSRQEVRALESIIGAVYQCRVFDVDNRSALVHKASAYCARLLRRADQCMAILACAHLYWQEKEDGKDGSTEESTTWEEELGYGAVKDGKGVVTCLKRALKFAHAAQQQLAVADRRQESATVPGQLFVEILNAYLYFFDRGVAEVTAEAVQGVLELTATELGGENCRDDQGLQAFYKRTLAHVQNQKRSEGSERYVDIQL
jgi:vacuolar protein sorting-associated protein 35